jgi:AraC-like DNA-binding protein
VTPWFAGFPLSVRWIGHEVMVRSKPLTYAELEGGLHHFTTIRYVIRGHGQLICNDQHLPLEEGMVFWTLPHVPYRFEPTDDAPLQTYAVLLEGAESETIARKYLPRDFGAIRLKHPEHVRAIFEIIVGEAQGFSPYPQENCVHLAWALLGNIASTDEDPSASARTFRRCKQHIRNHFADLNNLGEVATACNVSVSHLCRLFKDFHDCSAYEYVKKLKMEAAEIRLLGTQTSIKEVARSLGYKNCSLFAKNFKSVTGKTPRSYRKVKPA